MPVNTNAITGSSHDTTDVDAARDEVRRILHARDLDRDQKIERLRQLSYDARELLVASEEGMQGEPPDLAAILQALHELGADDAVTDAKQ